MKSSIKYFFLEDYVTLQWLFQIIVVYFPGYLCVRMFAVQVKQSLSAGQSCKRILKLWYSVDVVRGYS